MNKKEKTKASGSNHDAEQPMMMIPGIDVGKIIERTIEEQVRKQVSERIDKLILAVIHGSTNLGIWCPHRDDNMIRLTNDARKHIQSEIQRSFRDEVLHQVSEMSDNLKASIKQRVDENMALFEVGQGNWVFKIMADQIKAHIAKTIAQTVKGLTIHSDPDDAEEEE